MEDEEGDGGKCEKSEPWARRVWCASPWLEDEELADACLECLTVTDKVSLRPLIFSLVEAVDGEVTPRLLCLRTEVLSFSFAVVDAG